MYDDISNLLVKSKASRLFLDKDLPSRWYHRKLEIKRREDVYRKLLIRKERSKQMRRKFRKKVVHRATMRRAREIRGYKFVELDRYYSLLEQSYWHYLRRKYGTKNILSLEEFDTHIAPRYTPGVNILTRKDKSRKDWFLDNIDITHKHQGASALRSDEDE